MSTKIYDAFKFNDKPEKLINTLQSFRKFNIDFIKNEINRLWQIGFKFPNVQDPSKSKLVGNLNTGEMMDFIKWCLVEKPFKEKYHDTSAISYFYKDNIYVQFFGMYKSLDQFIQKNKSFIDYHYQDSTDMSNHNEVWNEMTDQRKMELESDWLDRKNVWDKILGSHTPEFSGLLYSLEPSIYEIYGMASDIMESKTENNRLMTINKINE